MDINFTLVFAAIAFATTGFYLVIREDNNSLRKELESKLENIERLKSIIRRLDNEDSKAKTEDTEEHY